MFRIKIMLVAAFVMTAATAAVYFQVTERLSDSGTQRVEANVLHAQQQIIRSSRLESVDLTMLAAEFAREPAFAQLLTNPADEERRRSGYVECQAHFARLEADGRRPGIIGVVDATGHLLARDHSFTWRSGEDLTKDFPSLTQALTKQPNKDVWDIDGAMYRVAAAPVHSPQGTVVGAVFVGYVHSADDARAEAERSGVDVAYFFETKSKMKIHSSSYRRGEGQSSESSEERALAEKLFSGANPLAEPATARHERTGLFRITVNGQEWVGAAAPLAGNVERSATKSGFVVLSSLTAEKARSGPIGGMVLGLGVLGLLAALGAAGMTARRFLNPLDQIEAGVAEVINGNRDYVFEAPSQDFEGLANGINVMLARLLGRPEPGDEEEGERESQQSVSQSEWRRDALFVDEAAAAGGASVASSAEAQRLAAEPADAYYQRVWTEYCAAREQTGEGIEGLDVQQFIAKLSQNEATLCKKYGARMVRFRVVIKGQQTTLKPVPIA